VNDDLKQDKARKIQCYKLIVDPALHKGQKKLYRIDGVIRQLLKMSFQFKLFTFQISVSALKTLL